MYKFKQFKLVSLVLLVICIASYLFLNKIKDNKNLIAYAREIVSHCSSSQYKPNCYEEEISGLMSEVTMEEAFEVTKLVQKDDPSYAYCHVLGHKLSEIETAKDPTRWKDVIGRCPSGVCSNGCIHGAFQERFRAEALSDQEIEKNKSELASVCEPRPGWDPTGLEQGTCYHALGHLLMYITDANIHKSVSLCEELSKKSYNDWSQLCFDGAFMQIFQPLEPEDFALIEGKQPKREQMVSFCSAFGEKPKGSCWNESWPLSRDQILTSAGLNQFCTNSLLNEENQNRCFTAMFYVVTAQLQFDLSKIKNLCVPLPGKRSAQCFAQAAARLIETDYGNISSAIKFCSEANNDNDKNECFSELAGFSKFNFHPESEGFLKLCSSLPDKWKQECLN